MFSSFSFSLIISSLSPTVPTVAALKIIYLVVNSALGNFKSPPAENHRLLLLLIDMIIQQLLGGQMVSNYWMVLKHMVEPCKGNSM